MKEFLLVLSIWGQTSTGNWEYIGNQYVNNTLMTKEVCEEKIKKKNWSVHETNQYYAIKFDCFHQSKEIK